MTIQLQLQNYWGHHALKTFYFSKQVHKSQRIIHTPLPCISAQVVHPSLPSSFSYPPLLLLSVSSISLLLLPSHTEDFSYTEIASVETWFPCKAAGVVRKIKSLLSSRLGLNLPVSQPQRLWRCFLSKFSNTMVVVMHVHCVVSADFIFAIFLSFGPSADCYAPSVAPPSCPPLTALVTHAVYSQSGGQDRGKSYICSWNFVASGLGFSFCLLRTRECFVFFKINSDLTVLQCQFHLDPLWKCSESTKALHRNPFSFSAEHYVTAAVTEIKHFLSSPASACPVNVIVFPRSHDRPSESWRPAPALRF